MAFSHYNTISTKLIVNPDPMTDGLKKGEDNARNGANRIQGAFNAASLGVGQLGTAITSVVAASNSMNQSSQMLLGTLTNIGTGFAMGGGIGAGIGAITALANLVTSTRERTKALGEEMENTINLANTFGITVKQLGEIRFAGLIEGVDPELMSKLLLKASEVASGSDDELGKIGLSRAQIAGKSHYEQLMMIVDAWKAAMAAAGGYSDAVAKQVGEKSYAKIAPLIQLGSGGIADSAKGQNIPGIAEASAIDWMADQLTLIEQRKKNDEVQAKFRQHLFDQAQKEFQKTNPYGVLDPATFDFDKAIADARKKSEEAEAERIAKMTAAEKAKRDADEAAKYSLRGNAADFGPSRADLGASLAFNLAERERRAGLSAFAPITSLLAGGADLTTFAGQQEIQRLATTVGGQKKTEEERIIAVNEKELKEAEENNRLNNRMIELLEQGISLTPGAPF